MIDEIKKVGLDDKTDLEIFETKDKLIKEWIYWLSYINNEDKELLELLKDMKYVSYEERKILNVYQEELSLLKALKRYSKGKADDADCKLVQKYLTGSIEKVILRRLSSSDYDNALRLYGSTLEMTDGEIKAEIIKMKNVNIPAFRYATYLILKYQYQVNVRKSKEELFEKSRPFRALNSKVQEYSEFFLPTRK